MVCTGEPIEEFTRLWLQAGPHALFIIDRIRAAKPVRTVWNWLLNNRDDASTFQVHDGHTVTMRRGLAGMTLAHGADGRLNGPVYGVMHDGYHPEPNQQGEGHSGSGMIYRWIEPEPRKYRLALHAIAVDDYGLIDRWTIEQTIEQTTESISLVSPDQRWTLTIHSDTPLHATLQCEPESQSWQLNEETSEFQFNKSEKDAPR